MLKIVDYMEIPEENFKKFAFDISRINIEDIVPRVANNLGMDAGNFVKLYEDDFEEGIVNVANDVLEGSEDVILVDIGSYRGVVPKWITMDNSRSGYVYFMTDGEYVKIGVTSNIKNRLSQLQTSSSKQVVIIDSMECSDPYGVEACLHHYFREFSVSGEWFDLLPVFGLMPQQCILYALGLSFNHVQYRYNVVINGKCVTLFDKADIVFSAEEGSPWQR